MRFPYLVPYESQGLITRVPVIYRLPHPAVIEIASRPLKLLTKQFGGYNSDSCFIVSLKFGVFIVSLKLQCPKFRL